jgi:hypothetical protein
LVAQESRDAEERTLRYFLDRLPGLTAAMPDLQRGQSAGL